jgi:hypothetical protein
MLPDFVASSLPLTRHRMLKGRASNCQIKLAVASSPAYGKTEAEWAERAARHIKAELKRSDLTYDDLAERLKKHGFKESKASIANKLARATLPAHFLLASLAAIGREQVVLSDI